MNARLAGKDAAILATHGFEQAGLRMPARAGADVDVIAQDAILGFGHFDRAAAGDVDLPLDDAGAIVADR